MESRYLNQFSPLSVPLPSMLQISLFIFLIFYFALYNFSVSTFPIIPFNSLLIFKPGNQGRAVLHI
jgi:hypothetical protein